MRNIDLDVESSLDLINYPFLDESTDCFKMYFNTNEKLDKVFSIVDMKDKNVLTVQASSDQLFKCMEHGAKEIDTFDINYLSKYYFYLKKYYLLEYSDMPHYGDSKLMFLELLKKFNKEDIDELEAFLYWKKLFEYISIEEFYRMFYIYPYYLDYDIDKIKERLENFKLNFNLINMFDNNYYTDKKYDIVIMSNIMESTGVLSKSHKQLERLVVPEGEVLCSNLATYSVLEHSLYERANMDLYFRYNEGLKEIDDGHDYQLCYKYIRR